MPIELVILFIVALAFATLITKIPLDTPIPLQDQAMNFLYTALPEELDYDLEPVVRSHIQKYADEGKTVLDKEAQNKLSLLLLEIPTTDSKHPDMAQAYINESGSTPI